MLFYVAVFPQQKEFTEANISLLVGLTCMCFHHLLDIVLYKLTQCKKKYCTSYLTAISIKPKMNTCCFSMPLLLSSPPPSMATGCITKAAYNQSKMFLASSWDVQNECSRWASRHCGPLMYTKILLQSLFTEKKLPMWFC